MVLRRLKSTYCFFFLIAPSVVAQHAPTPQSILADALAGLNATSVQSATLSGSAELIAGSTDETGSFTATCSTDGSSQLQINLASESRTETRAVSDGSAVGTWSDHQGEVHGMSGHNLLTPQAWFCPQVSLAQFLLDSNKTIQFIGLESKDGASVAHFSILDKSSDSKAEHLWTERLSRTELFLDLATLRPVALTFNIHPDDNAGLDIPVEVRFSDFRNDSGVWMPSRIDKYVNSTLSLTLQVTSNLSSTSQSSSR